MPTNPNHPILEAIADGRTDLVFDHLAQGHPATSSDPDGVPLIQWCAYYGDVSALRYLLEGGAGLSALGEDLGLNAAAFHGHWRLCQFLLERGAEPNRPLPDTGETPLHAALCKPDRTTYEYVVEILLAAGADPNHATLPGVETGCFMRDTRTRAETPLHRAAAYGTERSIRLLLDAGAVIDARDDQGESPLTWASRHGRPAHVLQLLCFDDHRIHPLAVERSRGYPCPGRADGMEMNLLGRPRV
jgi:ankyrin repeat protein